MSNELRAELARIVTAHIRDGGTSRCVCGQRWTPVHVAGYQVVAVERRIAQARAEAWSEGYERGRSDHCDYYPSAESCDISSPNPHRQHAEGVGSDG